MGGALMEGGYLKVSHLTSVSFRIFRQSVLKIDNSLGQLAAQPTN
jgi:hypothetical protein